MTEDGVTHVVERVTDPERIAAIQAVLAADDVLIADGHHRYGVSRIYRDEVRAATGRTDTPAEQTLAFVSELVADQLSVAAIHRLYAGIDLDAAAARHWRTGSSWRRRPRRPRTPCGPWRTTGFLVLHTATGTWTADARARGLRRRPRPRRRLAGGARWPTLPAEVSYQHGLDEALAAVADGARGRRPC